MARAGLRALEFYDPKAKKHGQAHMQARCAIDGVYAGAEREGQLNALCDTGLGSRNTLSRVALRAWKRFGTRTESSRTCTSA